ncbi:interleukin-1 receptor type 1 isoform X2 [Hemibagrus wyckioides]|uniref:interleukin-1 receptor type 1 isoform X2 n=1 Tax=Hemibagrus wyckioides TaxID=337641 RepID=UPI00266CEDD9|nr:interleukin-1 receptor type 1 isoform X2 [Hemibagrus wyckioides]
MRELRVIICFLAEFIMACASMNYSTQCECQMTETVQVIQGEGLRLPCPHSECRNEATNSPIFWFKEGSEGIQPISMEENERVHYHEGVLYFLPFNLNDTGVYITQWWYHAHACDEFKTKIVVFEKFHLSQVYANLSEKTEILFLDCPVWNNCKKTKGEISWYKDFHLIPHKSNERFKVNHNLEKSIGIYTCMCTWEYHAQLYNTSRSIQVLRQEKSVAFPPTFQHPINNSVQLVDLGKEVKLNCLVFFGINIKTNGRRVFWQRNGSNLNTNYRMENGSMLSSFTISQVSEADLRYKYCCEARSLYEVGVVCITLKTRESLIPMILTFSYMVLFLLLAAWIVNFFTVDLVLFFRSFRIMQRKREDCTELIEKKMQLSRRLIAVLPPGVSHHQGVTTSLCYDWEVGLHQVLVEQELKVILIQLGDMMEYSHLPLGLQHLLQKTPPLRWDECKGKATCPSSRFWKQVRYMMPVPSVSSSRDVDF